LGKNRAFHIPEAGGIEFLSHSEHRGKIYFVQYVYAVFSPKTIIIPAGVNILAQRVRLWITPGRGCSTVERVKSEIRISKSETNLKFECSNAKNNQENIHFITVYLF